MNVESIREYALSLPLATEDCAFGEDNILFRVAGKIFACLSIQGDDYLALKCDPDYALELRATYAEIAPAWHWNKKFWNQVSFRGNLPDSFIEALIRHSYAEVVKKLTRKFRLGNPDAACVK